MFLNVCVSRLKFEFLGNSNKWITCTYTLLVLVIFFSLRVRFIRIFCKLFNRFKPLKQCFVNFCEYARIVFSNKIISKIIYNGFWLSENWRKVLQSCCKTFSNGFKWKTSECLIFVCRDQKIISVKFEWKFEIHKFFRLLNKIGLCFSKCVCRYGHRLKFAFLSRSSYIRFALCLVFFSFWMSFFRRLFVQCSFDGIFRGKCGKTVNCIC